MSHSPSQSRLLLPAVGLAITTALVYFPVVSHGFVSYDDSRDILHNTVVGRGLTLDGVRWAFTTGMGGNWIPLVWLTHMIDCQLWGLGAGGHHATDMLLHVASTVILFVTLARMTGAVGRSAFVAGAFALHPLHVESVAWVAERKDTLSGLFWMITLWAYAHYARRPALTRYLPVAVAFAAGLMAKPMVVSLPFILLLLDVWPLGRYGHARDVRPIAVRLVLEKLPLVIVAAAASAVAVFMQRQAGVLSSLREIPLGLRLENAVVSYAMYVEKMVWPTGLAVLYPYPKTIAVSQFAFSGFAVSVLSVLAIALARRRPYLLVGWFWYLVTLVPVIGLVQVGRQAMADRYTYLPLIGLFIALAWGAVDVAGTRVRQPMLAAAGGAWLAVCATVTHRQLRYWQSSEALYGHALAVTTGNWVMHYNMGVLLEEEHRNDEAIENYLASASENPAFFPPRNQLALLYAKRGNADEATAMHYYREALRLQRRNAGVYNNLANFLANRGRPDDAVKHFRKAVRILPDYVEAHSNFALALVKLGRYDEAVLEARSAVALNPAFAPAQNVLGTALAKQGHSAD